MINVSSDTINAYKTDGVHKEVTITCGIQTFLNEDIVSGSLDLSQSILDGSNFDICGCVSNSISFKIYNDVLVTLPQRGDQVTLSVRAGNTQTIKLFTGTVDTCDAQANSNFATVTAYDKLYKISGQGGYVGEENDEYNIASWFTDKRNITISDLLTQLCSKFSVTIANNNPSLINGGITIRTKEEGKNPKVTSLSALDLMRDIFRINACFGYIDPDGNLAWLYLSTSPYDLSGRLYPSDFVFPSGSLYGGVDSSQTPDHDPNFIGCYETLNYKSYQVNPIKRVVVADGEKDKNKAEAGSGYNKYTIYGNHCMLGEDQSKKSTAANNILSKLRDIFYVPFDASNYGLPFLQPGDQIAYYDAKRDQYYRTFIFSRTLKLSQHMTDGFKADGEQYQREFKVGSDTQVNEINDEKVDEIENEISDINDNLDDFSDDLSGLTDDLSGLTDDYNDFKDYVSDYIDSGGGGGTAMVNVLTVDALPLKPSSNTIYLIRGEALII